MEGAGPPVHQRCPGEVRTAGVVGVDGGCNRVRLQIAECRLQIECKLQIESEINLQSAMQEDVMKLTGAQILWETMVREGVTDIFGYPGGAILPAYDAMLGYPIRHILVRHEQGATHMADGYARASGKVGVAIATSGPGATNMVTGIA